MLLAIHSVIALPQPEYLGYTSAISRNVGVRLSRQNHRHVRRDDLVRHGRSQTGLISNLFPAPMVVEMLQLS